jgi:DNA-binding NarL/FixJ family response regulator
MPIPLVTRILVADDHPIVRSGLRQVLDAEADLEVVAEAEDGAEAIRKGLAEDVDIAILDVSMPKTTGIQAAAELRKRKPELKLLMLSMYDSEQFLFESLKAGAAGYVLKSDADQDIVEAVRRTMRGQSFLYPSAVSTLVKDALERGRADGERFDVLTARELQDPPWADPALVRLAEEPAQQLEQVVRQVRRLCPLLGGRPGDRGVDPRPALVGWKAGEEHPPDLIELLGAGLTVACHERTLGCSLVRVTARSGGTAPSKV